MLFIIIQILGSFRPPELSPLGTQHLQHQAVFLSFLTLSLAGKKGCDPQKWFFKTGVMFAN